MTMIRTLAKRQLGFASHLSPRRRGFASGLAVVVAVATASLSMSGCRIDGGAVLPCYAIVYGVADYNGATGDLNFPDDDAIDMAALLTANGYTVTLRTNSEATRSNLDLDFAAVAAVAEADSRFVFYFAGHGFGDGMEANYSGLPTEWKEYFDAADSDQEPFGAGPYPDYIFFYDAMPITQDVEASLAECASDDELAALIRLVPSAQKMVIIDACHSGGFIGTTSSYDAVPRGYDGSGEGVSFVDLLSAMTLYLEYSGLKATDIAEGEAIVLTAAGEQEFSYEYPLSAPIDNGIFTHYLLQAADFGDRNFDGVVTVSEAYRYTAEQITRIENDSLAGDGKFFPRVSGGPVDFVLFR